MSESTAEDRNYAYNVHPVANCRECGKNLDRAGSVYTCIDCIAGWVPNEREMLCSLTCQEQHRMKHRVQAASA